MADLEQAKKLQSSLFGKRELNTQDLVNYAASKTLDQMMEKMTAPNVSPEDFQAAIGELKNAFKAIFKEILSVRSSVDARPDSFDPVLKAINELKDSVDAMTQAVMGIRIPETKIPEFPKIPEPKDVDLSPVLMESNAIKDILVDIQNRASEVRESEPVVVKHEPRSWVFDVKRNQSGLIRSVEVNEQ